MFMRSAVFAAFGTLSIALVLAPSALADTAQVSFLDAAGNSDPVGGVDGQASGVDGGVDGPVADEVAGGAFVAARGAASVLA
jgi:hypothetical protein